MPVMSKRRLSVMIAWSRSWLSFFCFCCDDLAVLPEGFFSGCDLEREEFVVRVELVLRVDALGLVTLLVDFFFCPVSLLADCFVLLEFG